MVAKRYTQTPRTTLWLLRGDIFRVGGLDFVKLFVEAIFRPLGEFRNHWITEIWWGIPSWRLPTHPSKYADQDGQYRNNTNYAKK